MTEAVSVPIRRGRRKSRRLDEIVEVGARLIYSSGFTKTSVADVTREIGIAPSAMYRHVPSKERLLETILDRRFLDYETALDECHGWDSIAEVLAPVAIAHRDLGVLWQREARHMAETAYENLASRLRMVAKRISVNLDDPSLKPAPIARAWATISVLTSLSYHSSTMSGIRLRALLRQLILGTGTELTRYEPAVQWSEEQIVSAAARKVDDDDLDPTDRAILVAAAKLYGTHGYHKVSMTDLGQAVGMAGPSIYYRYESKGAVLAAVLQRANARMYAEARAVLDHAPDPQAALRGLLNSYARLVLNESHVVEALLSEIPELADTNRQPTADKHARYIRAWVQQLRLCHPGMTTAEASIRVHAATTIINDLARTHSTRAELSLQELCDLAWGALMAGLPRQLEASNRDDE